MALHLHFISLTVWLKGRNACVCMFMHTQTFVCAHLCVHTFVCVSTHTCVCMCITSASNILAYRTSGGQSASLEEKYAHKYHMELAGSGR